MTGAGNMGKGECCFAFGERVRQFITVNFSVTGDPPEAQSYTKGGGIGKVFDIPEGLWLEKRRGRGEEGEGWLGVSNKKGQL